VALRRRWVATAELSRDAEAQNAVSEELEALVRAHAIRHQGRVRDRLARQAVIESVQ
jgi:hypothetical protein